MAQAIDVSDVAGLRAAITSAAPGSTIRLAPGDYAGIDVNRAIDGAPVAISGPRDARLIQMKFTAPARNWHLRGVTLLAGKPDVGPYGGSAVTFTRAQDVALDDVLIHGVAPGPDSWNEGSKGLALTQAQGIVLANSQVRHVRLLAALQDSRGVVLVNNDFQDARDGVLVSNVQGLLIRNNLFQGWLPRYDLKEHPDMIQFWTRHRPHGSARVEISNNLMDAGENRAVQGIFARAEDMEYNKAPQGFHRDWVIRNNIYFGSSKHGISLSDVQGVLVENNSVLASPHAFVGRQPISPDGRSGTGYKPFILLLRTTKGEVRGNIAPFIATAKTATVLTDNNLIFQPAKPADAVNPKGSFAAPIGAGKHDVKDFLIVAGSEAQRTGRGADASQVGPRAQPEALAGLQATARALADVVDEYLNQPAEPAPAPR
ncbi:right-handed parallel beta-helix repeat-containing protein [Sandarakinorhabdus sp.]|uniref:right-handed parallel beta-helix repeat-containing protein n=1 Tax=Sandarakinorhabdus sp. TaxID=1916663 RepID=UPI003F6E8A84